jgi:hypothetical protein
MDELVAPIAEPVIVLLQAGNADTPPVGTVIVNVKAFPESVPAMFL